MDDRDKKPKQPQWTPTQLNIGYFLVALLAILLFQAWLGYRETEQLLYSDFQRLLDEGRIAEVVVTDNRIQGRYVAPRNGRSYFITNRVDPELSRRLEEAGVEFTGIDEAYERSRKILQERRDDLTAGTRLLLAKETITPEDFPALVQPPTKQAAE